MPERTERLARQVSQLYWDSDATVGEIARRLGLSRRGLYSALVPVAAGGACMSCGAELVYINRSKRAAGQAECSECGRPADLSNLGPATTRAAPALGEPAIEAAAPTPAPPTPPPIEAEPQVEQLEEAGPRAPVHAAAAVRRTNILLLGGIVATGVLLGAVALAVARRRK